MERGLPARALTAPKANVLVVIEPAVVDREAEKVGPKPERVGHGLSRARVPRRDAAHGFRESRIQRLVAVEREHPRRGRLRPARVSLVAVADVATFDDPRPGAQ